MRRPSPAMIVALLGLFVGLGGVGVAATGGNFILGQANSAGAKTSLTAPINDRALLVSNTNTGSNAAGLSLNVASHHAPLVVNSDAGKATNLDADKRDGNDSSSFLPKTGTAANASKLGGQLPSYYLPAGGKATDSDKLDGLDSTSFAAKAQEPWHEVGAPGEPPFWYECGETCAPVFQNFGFGYNTAGFYRDSLGRVYLKGLVTLVGSSSASCGPIIFFLPVGYRPAATEIAAVVHDDNLALGRIDIRNDGRVEVCTASSVSTGEWWALDGISFRAA
jgi:hypothetical protein